MPECELVHQSERRTAKDRNLAAGLQRTTSAQFVELLAARRVCQDSGDDGMRKASTRLLEQGIQAPSPAPDLIPAETKTSTENLHWDWYSKRGHFSPIRKRKRWLCGQILHLDCCCAGGTPISNSLEEATFLSLPQVFAAC